MELPPKSTSRFLTLRFSIFMCGTRSRLLPLESVLGVAKTVFPSTPNFSSISESIGGFYMTTSVVSIEKQFQIPSKVSGTMVSAGDFGYIPTVVFVAYLGGKGNRAKWIGFGCILIALANILISSSNFLFDEKLPNSTMATAAVNQSDVSSALIPVNLYSNCSAFKRILLSGNESIFGDYTECGEGNHRAKPLLITSSFAYCNPEVNMQKIQVSEEGGIKNRSSIIHGPVQKVVRSNI